MLVLRVMYVFYLHLMSVSYCPLVPTYYIHSFLCPKKVKKSFENRFSCIERLQKPQKQEERMKTNLK